MSSAADSSCLSPRKRSHSVSQRRQNKPLIEKRRRARINECLLQLKALLMKDLGKESPRPSKLEKADILEMTVDYIKKMADKKPDISRSIQEKTEAPFLDGFSRCMEEVDSFLNTQLDLQPEVRHKLLLHCRQQISTKDFCLETSATVSSPLHSPPEEEPTPVKSAVCDNDSDDSSSDDSKMTMNCAENDVTQGNDVSTSDRHAPSSTFVTPFPPHTPNSTSSTPPETNAHSVTPDSGIKVAGPLRLICGGNVFIVVDQQQQGQSRDTYQVLSTPAVAGQVSSTPAVYSGSGLAAYIPTWPSAAVGGFTAVPASGLPIVTTTPSYVLSQNLQHQSGPVTVHSKPADTSLSPPLRPYPGDLRQVGNDVNNNEVNFIGQAAAQAVWRPW